MLMNPLKNLTYPRYSWCKLKEPAETLRSQISVKSNGKRPAKKTKILILTLDKVVCSQTLLNINIKPNFTERKN